MPEWITWVFDGIGSTIFSLITGALIGGAVGYKIGVHKNVKQKQTGGDNVCIITGFLALLKIVFYLSSIFGNIFIFQCKLLSLSEQVQIGGIKRGR